MYDPILRWPQTFTSDGGLKTVTTFKLLWCTFKLVIFQLSEFSSSLATRYTFFGGPHRTQDTVPWHLSHPCPRREKKLRYSQSKKGVHKRWQWLWRLLLTQTQACTCCTRGSFPNVDGILLDKWFTWVWNINLNLNSLWTDRCLSVIILHLPCLES